MVMVPEDRYEPVLPGQGMDLLKSFLGPVTAVEEIPEINKDINRAKDFHGRDGDLMHVASAPIATESACTSEKITAPIPVPRILVFIPI